MKLLDLLFKHFTNFAETSLDREGFIEHQLDTKSTITLNNRVVSYIRQTSYSYAAYDMQGNVIDKLPKDNINQWEFVVSK